MNDELFAELMASAREGGKILRAEKALIEGKLSTEDATDILRADRVKDIEYARARRR